MVSPELPWIDEHATVVEADPETTWEALESVLGGPLGRGARRIGRILRPRDVPSPGDRFRSETGSVAVGFRVVDADRPARLALEGEHRFSRYALIFRLEELGPHRSRIRAETRAEFPGVQGRMYRALVIGTRAHVAAVRSMLRAVRRAAER